MITIVDAFTKGFSSVPSEEWGNYFRLQRLGVCYRNVLIAHKDWETQNVTWLNSWFVQRGLAEDLKNLIDSQLSTPHTWIREEAQEYAKELPNRKLYWLPDGDEARPL
jgi:hypothetical protein